MLGRGVVFQLMKMSGQVLVGLESIEKAERLSEEGLTIKNTLLKVFPYRKRAEKIVIGNPPIAIRDEDIVAALRPYCRVVSLTHEVVASGGYTWTTGSREAFILLNEGLKIHQLPAKLIIVSKGESTPAYITYGVRCSKCRRQGHRRATCPLDINGGRHQDTRQGLVSKSLSPTSSLTTPPQQLRNRLHSLSRPPKHPPALQLLPRPEPSLAIIEPTAAPKKETHNKTAPSIQSSTSMTQPMQPLQESQEILIERVEGIFEQMNADSFLSPLNEEVYPVTAIKNSRQQQDLAKARSAAATFDQCCLVEWSADFHPVQYTLELEQLLGKSSVKIVVGNLPLSIWDDDVIAALRSYCRVVSLTHEVVFSGGYTWTTSNREAFVLLTEGRKLHQLSAKLVIISKGESTPAYITYGVMCSKCLRQGHRKAICPIGINGGRHQDLRQGPVSRPPSSKPMPSNNSALSTPAAESSAPIGQTNLTPSSPAASSPGANIPVHPQETPIPEPPFPAPSTSQLLPRPEPFLTIIDPTAAPKNDP
ncbi:hypothetical protein LAZ67_7001466 [Cordylochernes scorpioides]|uniref:CCHC-type domain-containing protein n=1 Tax=Cordylochernes scorpioides TaxID=51811 RepID=A0ABY6KMW5_9ARAC|nr:hypothetical protein LAZ67_7001466 [Cordylochernes scorpioides]